jgi:hypothetical protein
LSRPDGDVTRYDGLVTSGILLTATAETQVMVMFRGRQAD